MLLARALRMLELGDDAARALGVGGRAVRLALIFVGVALAAVATASAGPIVFVALAAPQIARRLTRAGGPGVGCAALTGARAAAGRRPRRPAAVRGRPAARRRLTGVFGGVYLIWLLTREWRRGADERPACTGDELTLAYDQRVVSEGLDVAIPDGSFTAIVGPNACGKSTLLRALARMLKPKAGR